MKQNNLNKYRSGFLPKITMVLLATTLIACGAKKKYVSGSESNKSLVKQYSKQLTKSTKTNVFAIQSANYKESVIDYIKSDCEAWYNSSNQTLINDDQCYARFWMQDVPGFANPYEFIYDFEFPNGLSVPENKYPLQIFLGNSPNGYTWLGVNKEGELLLSYMIKNKGYTDLILSDSNFKVDPAGLNKLKFVQMPNGYFYLELNKQRVWSFDLERDKQKIPLVGISNRIAYYADVSIKQLELNVLNPN